MKKILLSIVYLISTIAFAQYTVPGVWYSSNKTLLVGASKAGIVLDGELNEISWQNAGYTVTGGVPQFPNKIENKMSFNLSVTSTLTGVPSDDEFVGDASFGLCWDHTNLYIGVVLNNPKDVELLSWDPLATASGIEFYISNTKNSSNTPEPHVYIEGLTDRDYHIAVGYIKSGINKYSTTTTGMVSVLNGSISGDAFKTFVRKEGNNVFMEIAVSWDSINKPYRTLPANEVPCGLVTREGRKLGFDIQYNIPKTTILGNNIDNRAAFKSWNACCINRNWTETINYGTVELTGSNGLVYFRDINFINNNVTLSGIASTTLGIITDPQEDDFRITYRVINNKPNLPAVSINSRGTITTLNEGVATIIGTANPANYDSPQCFVKSVTTSIIRVNNILKLDSIRSEPLFLSTPFEEGKINFNYYPPIASTLTTWSIISSSGNNLAIINSISGIINVSGNGDGIIIVKGTSVANPSVSKITNVYISNQPLPEQLDSNIVIRTKAYQACGVQNYKNTSVSGYAYSSKIYLQSYYLNAVSCNASPISNEIIKYKLKPRVQNAMDPPHLVLSEDEFGPHIRIYKLNDEFPVYAIINNRTITSTFVAQQNLTTCTSSIEPKCIALSLENNNHPSSISIYPNPSSGQIYIECLSPSRVQIFNLIGVLVASFETAESHAITLPKGIYFVKVNGNKTSLTKKIIVE